MRARTNPTLLHLPSRCCFRAKRGLREHLARRAKLHLKNQALRESTAVQKVSEEVAIVIAADVEAVIAVDAIEADETVVVVIAAIENLAAVSLRLRCQPITRQCCCRANRFRNIAVHP
jgi:hypothetical protein